MVTPETGNTDIFGLLIGEFDSFLIWQIKNTNKIRPMPTHFYRKKLWETRYFILYGDLYQQKEKFKLYCMYLSVVLNKMCHEIITKTIPENFK